MFLRQRADYGTHFDFDTTSGKTDGKLLTGMKNSIQPSFRHKRVPHKQGRNTIKYRGKVREWTITSIQVVFSR